MRTGKIAWGVVAVMAIAGLGAAFIAARTAREATSTLAAASSRQAALNANLAGLEKRVQTAVQQGQLAEQENARLLGAVPGMKAAAASAAADAEPVSLDAVIARLNRARRLIHTGNPADLLRELLWCYDVGLSSSGPVRLSGAVGALGELAEIYPPARDALRARRDKAKLAMDADDKDRDALSEFAAINRVLKEDAETVAMLDQLPAADPRRRTLAMNAQDYLIANRRYPDALVGSPYSTISSIFEMLIQERPLPADTPDPIAARLKQREQTVALTAKNIEVLAGAGDLIHASAMAERLIAYDGTEKTRALIQQHATRAGHPELLVPPGH
jgi:hypothetical protein